MPLPRRTTIREIARACGVSVQTVSRVLNGRPDVAPATRALVEATIAASDYRPSATARSLVRGRSRILGVIVAGLGDFGVAETLNGIAAQAEAAGYAILLKEIDVDDRSTIEAVFDVLIGHGVDGILFAAPEMATPTQALPSASPPVVSLKTADASARVSVLIDNRG